MGFQYTDIRTNMPEEFQFDVFLSYSSKDKVIVRDIAEQLRKDGVKVWFDEWALKPGDSIPVKIEEGMEQSRVLVLCMSANAFGSDWAQLDSGTFRFRDPLNKERRFLPLRLDDAPIKGSLAQFLYIDWQKGTHDQAYVKLLESCLPTGIPFDSSRPQPLAIKPLRTLRLKGKPSIQCLSFSKDCTFVVSGGYDNSVGKWSLKTGQAELLYAAMVAKKHASIVWSVAVGADESQVIVGDHDNVWILSLESDAAEYSLRGGEGGCYNGVAWCPGGDVAISGSMTGLVEVWDTDRCHHIASLEGHEDIVRCVSLNRSGTLGVSGGDDFTVRFWDLQRMACFQVCEGHLASVRAVTWTKDERLIVSAGEDSTIRVWDVDSGLCELVLRGHQKSVNCISCSPIGDFLISGSEDRTVRLWSIESGNCLAVFRGHKGYVQGVAWSECGSKCFSGDKTGHVYEWEISELLKHAIHPIVTHQRSTEASDQIQYTNAKVLLVGETNAGKTGLTHRLATREWKPSEDSTVGAWSTQLSLKPGNAEPGVDREIWLWDFGGQADQRLIHQLYMDRTSLILLLFNADQEDVLPGLRDWQTALRRCLKGKNPHFLVAGRIDTGFKASRGKLQAFAQEQGLAYHETSAKSGDGCDELRAAMIAGIPWDQMEKRTSPRIFKLIKDEILKLRDEGQVLHTFKELRELLWQRLTNEPRFTDETLQTVIGLLDGPGVVKELDYGTYILLAPEWVNAYAQAVIRTLRSAENDLGVLPLRSIAEGELIYQSIGRDGVPVGMKRLPLAEERVVLGEMERQLEQRGLCLRQGDKLVFPSHCGRDRPAMQEHPSVFVSYAVKGFLDDIYATLVVKLADSESFQLKELWRDAANFVTLDGDHHMGLKLTRESGSDGDISVYFGKGVTQEEQVIFANYIHAHLQTSCEQAQRLRHYVCPKCHAPKGNAEVLMKKLLREKQGADTECDNCGKRFPLWDALEKKFASEAVRAQVEQLQADDLAKLDTRRRGKLLALEVGARITSADQKCFEIPATEDEGLDMELEFTNDDGKGTGCRLYLQLKSGNAYLTKRKTDGAEIFAIKKQRWVEYWLKQPHPVMLVIGTFSEDDERAIGKDKLEFAEVRWMEITSVLRRESVNGTKPVKQIEFKGERLDLSSVRKWRNKILAED